MLYLLTYHFLTDRLPLAAAGNARCEERFRTDDPGSRCPSDHDLLDGWGRSGSNPSLGGFGEEGDEC